jgi:thiaminase/transcriptional activator TenA
MYAGDEYQQVARDAAAFIETLGARRGGVARRDSLARTFTEATRLEATFWQQGLDAED